MDLTKIKLFLMDLDGTLYIDGKLIDGANETIEKLRKDGKKIGFVTNNTSIGKNDYLKKFKKIGLTVFESEFVSASYEMIEYLKKNNLQDSVYLLGTKSLKKEFEKNGIKLVDNAKTVVVAYDTELTYKKLVHASTLIKNGANYFSTHIDKVCPSKDKVLPDAGSYINLIYDITGKKPKFVGGKPGKDFAKYILNKFQVKKNQVCFIGDRLYTDIQFALNNGFNSILVLSGETKKEDLKECKIKPDLVLSTIKDIQKLID